MARARRIVVCDVSAERTRALTRFLERDPGLEVAATFDDVEALLAELERLCPDLVALDLGTAGADVAAAVEPLARERRASVLLLGARGEQDEDRVAAGLAAGALEAVAADKLGLDDPESVWAVALRSRIKRLANIRLEGDGGRPRPASPSRPWRKPGATYRALGIGASVGGPPALASVLRGLPAGYPLPILVVQHMAPGFGDDLAAWLDRSVSLPVALAEDGATLQPGVWMAPEGAHLRLERTLRLRLDRETDRGAHRPSVDVLFESLADALGAEAVGVVLTGMGRDGAEGVRALGDVDGLTIAQDEESAAVFGMPGAAIEVGVDQVLSLEELASRMAGLRARKAGA